MENENDQAQVSNEQEEVVLETTDDTEASEETSEESIEEVKAKLQAEAEARKKAEEIAKNQRIRAEKAESLVKQPKEVSKEQPLGMTTRDFIALSNAKINEDDIPEIEEYAKFKKISIADALKSNVVKTILSDKEEMRKTANATNTGNARKSTMKVSGDVLLDRARKGEEVDDIDALVQARFEAKKNRK